MNKKRFSIKTLTLGILVGASTLGMIGAAKVSVYGIIAIVTFLVFILIDLKESWV